MFEAKDRFGNPCPAADNIVLSLRDDTTGDLELVPLVNTGENGRLLLEDAPTKSGRYELAGGRCGDGEAFDIQGRFSLQVLPARLQMLAVTMALTRSTSGYAIPVGEKTLVASCHAGHN